MVSKEQIGYRKTPGASTFELQLELDAGLFWNCCSFSPPEETFLNMDPLRVSVFENYLICFSLLNYFGSALAPTIWALFSFG